jgi:hypothetical protein
VFGGGFGLWLGDNIAILSMVKRAHPLLSNNYFREEEIEIVLGDLAGT